MSNMMCIVVTRCKKGNKIFQINNYIGLVLVIENPLL